MGLLNNPKSSYIEVLRYTVFWLKWFLKWRGSSTPKSSEIIGHIFPRLLLVYLARPWDLPSGGSNFDFFFCSSKISFRREVLSSHIEETLKKKKVVHPSIVSFICHLTINVYSVSVKNHSPNMMKKNTTTSRWKRETMFPATKNYEH